MFGKKRIRCGVNKNSNAKWSNRRMLFSHSRKATIFRRIVFGNPSIRGPRSRSLYSIMCPSTFRHHPQTNLFQGDPRSLYILLFIGYYFSSRKSFKFETTFKQNRGVFVASSETVRMWLLTKLININSIQLSVDRQRQGLR